MRCDLKGVSCTFVEHCPEGCFQLHGATLCVDRAPVSARDEDNSGIVVQAQGKCDGVKNECRECTSSRRGAFTCIEGFCSVRPGDWCKNGWSCRDDCGCCKKDRKRGVRTVEALERTVEVREIPDGEFMLPVHELRDRFGSCLEKEVGHTYCTAQASLIVVCDPADLWWRGVGKCIGGAGCCEMRLDNPTSAQCKC